MVALAGADPVALLADWRHLGVFPRGGRALLIGGGSPSLHAMFDTTEVKSWEEIPQSPRAFQLIVSVGLSSRDEIAAIERVLDPSEGIAVICAPPRPAGPRRYWSLAGQTRVIRRLLRGTKLEGGVVYGTLPDPWVPEFVFPLTRPAAAFAIERFVLARRPAWGWVRMMLAFGPIVDLATKALPGGLIVCRIRQEGP